jgi:Trk-type K+ transport system membrane component
MRAMQTMPVGTQGIALLGSLLLQKRSLEINERLFKSGNDSELDLQQAKSLYLSTLATIPQLEVTCAITECIKHITDSPRDSYPK